MKGCLTTVIVVAVLAMLTLAGGTCYLANEVRDHVRRMEASFAEARDTDAEFPFEPVKDAVLTADRMDSFLAIRHAVCDPTIKKFDELTAWAEKDGIGLTETWKWSTAVREIIEKIPVRLIVSLREHRMGYTEYQWMTRTLHGVIASADHVGGHQQATEMVEAFQDYFASDGSSVEGEVNGRDFNYPAIRHHLEGQFKGFPPENLVLILSRAREMKEPIAQVMLDVLVLQVEKVAQDAPSRESDEPVGSPESGR